MIFNRHSEVQAGRHAFLSPSNWHWLNYTDQKLAARFESVVASRRGTDLHALAHESIRLGVKLSTANKAMATYVSDAIQYRMVCEQLLYYSDNCFGTADTIGYNRRKLRVHDLKTGITPSSFKQLEVYASIFCLEYQVAPDDIEIELRIYQRDDIMKLQPEPGVIFQIMEKIVDFDQQIEALKEARW